MLNWMIEALLTVAEALIMGVLWVLVVAAVIWLVL